MGCQGGAGVRGPEAGGRGDRNEQSRGAQREKWGSSSSGFSAAAGEERNPGKSAASRAQRRPGVCMRDPRTTILQVNRFSKRRDRALLLTDRHLYKLEPGRQYRVMQALPLDAVSAPAPSSCPPRLGQNPKPGFHPRLPRSEAPPHPGPAPPCLDQSTQDEGAGGYRGGTGRGSEKREQEHHRGACGVTPGEAPGVWAAALQGIGRCCPGWRGAPRDWGYAPLTLPTPR